MHNSPSTSFFFKKDETAQHTQAKECVKSSAFALPALHPRTNLNYPVGPSEQFMEMQRQSTNPNLNRANASNDHLNPSSHIYVKTVLYS